MRNITIIILGIGIGFVNTMFFEKLGDTSSAVINIVALMFILIGIAGIFREQI